jgi:hypothetical protein
MKIITTTVLVNPVTNTIHKVPISRDKIVITIQLLTRINLNPPPIKVKVSRILPQFVETLDRSILGQWSLKEVLPKPIIITALRHPIRQAVVVPEAEAVVQEVVEVHPEDHDKL